MALNNYFSLKLKQALAQEEKTQRINMEKSQANQQQMNSKFRLKMMQRLENYCDNKYSEDYLKSLKHGSIPLRHTFHHEFRDRKRELELHKQNIYVKTYQTAKVRADTAESEFQQSHLEREQYDSSKGVRGSLRVDELNKQGKPFRYGINFRTENQRLRDPKILIDTQVLNNKMIHYPSWKEDEPSKWITDRPFTVKSTKQKSPWKVFPLRLSTEEYSQSDDRQSAGYLTSRKSNQRDKQLFIPTVQFDVLASNLNYSQSLRTARQDQVLGIKEDHDSFASNEKIKNYKEALIKTKSIDHVVPHKHSNKQVEQYKLSTFGQQLSDLRPKTQGKIFINSLTHYNQSLMRKSPEVKAKLSNPQIQLPGQKTQSIRDSPIRQSLAQIQEVIILSNAPTIVNRKVQRDTTTNPFSDVEAQTVIQKYFQ